MRVCVILPQGEDTRGLPRTYQHADPSRYIETNIHQFERREIRQNRVTEDIDQLSRENHDVYFNLLTSYDNFHPRWIDAARYITSKGMPCIGHIPNRIWPSIGETRAGDEAHQSRHEEQAAFSFSFGDDDSVHLQSILARPGTVVDPTLSHSATAREGRGGCNATFSVLVVLVGHTALALTPLEHAPFDETPEHGGSNNPTASANAVPFRLAGDGMRAARLREVAVRAFNDARRSNYLAYARVSLHLRDICADNGTLRVDPFPFIFHPRGDPQGNDYVIEHGFPGGHFGFFEVLLSTTLVTMPASRDRNLACAGRHDNISQSYHEILACTNVTDHRLSPFIGTFNYDGTILECCPGSGALARYACDAGVRATFTGIELSRMMAQLPDSEALYQQPILIGPIQEVLMTVGKHDHVVCFGSFHLFTRADFVSSLCQMFLRARHTVSFDVDDLSPTYIRGSVGTCEEQQGTSWLDFNHNNVFAAIRFGIPPGWRATVFNKRRFAYHSPLMDEDVYTHSFRFERL